MAATLASGAYLSQAAPKASAAVNSTSFTFTDSAGTSSSARFYPAGPLLALAMCAIVIVGQNYEALIGNRNLLALLSSYIGLPFFLSLWGIHKLVTRQPKIDPRQADLSRARN